MGATEVSSVKETSHIELFLFLLGGLLLLGLLLSGSLSGGGGSGSLGRGGSRAGVAQDSSNVLSLEGLDEEAGVVAFDLDSSSLKNLVNLLLLHKTVKGVSRA